MEDKKIILGLDVSTTTIGICLMICENDKNEIVKLTHLTPKISSKIKGIEGLFLKKALFETEFLNNYSEYGITDVVIEEPLLSSNNINTVGTLLRFNGMISDSVYRILGLVPKYISSYDARRYSFPELMTIRKFNKKGEAYPKNIIQKAIKNNQLVLFGGYPWDVAKKDVIHSLISDIYPNIEWIYNKDNELKKENFDASDAAACCIGYINKVKHGEMNPIIIEHTTYNDEIHYIVKIWDKYHRHKL